MRIKWFGGYVIVVTAILLWWFLSKEARHLQREDEIRRDRSFCQMQATKQAQSFFMQKKAAAADWQQAQMPDGNYFIADYEESYRECLRLYGIEEGK